MSFYIFLFSVYFKIFIKYLQRDSESFSHLARLHDHVSCLVLHNSYDPIPPHPLVLPGAT
jgi:hypothetical protein